MKKICNWVFGSFFRTFGRVLVYLLFGYFLFTLFDYLDIDITQYIFSNVYAESNLIDRSNVSINASNSYENSGYYYNTFSTSGTNIRLQFLCYEDSQKCSQKVAVVSDICTGTGIDTLTRLSSLGSNCSNSCFQQDLSFYDLGRSCTLPNNNPGYIYRIYLPISKWSYGVGTSQNATIDDTIVLRAKWYNSYYNFTNFYLTDELVKDNQSWVQLNSHIDSLNSSINNASSQAHTDSQNVQNKLDNVNNTQKETNDLIKNDNTTEAENKATDFFTNFTTDNHGLTGIITAPLNAIQSLSSATCTPLELPLPFVNDTLTLPCMRPIYEEHFGSFMNIYDIITLGIISYWIMVRIFSLVKDFKNPDHDEIEVVDL